MGIQLTDNGIIVTTMGGQEFALERAMDFPPMVRCQLRTPNEEPRETFYLDAETVHAIVVWMDTPQP